MSLFCKPKPKVVRLFLRISPRDLGNEHAPRMTVAAVSAPTAASTGEDFGYLLVAGTVLSADGGARFLGGPFLDPKSADLVLFLAAFKIIFKSI